jgi:hypothetical protein
MLLPRDGVRTNRRHAQSINLHDSAEQCILRQLDLPAKSKQVFAKC